MAKGNGASSSRNTVIAIIAIIVTAIAIMAGIILVSLGLPKPSVDQNDKRNDEGIVINENVVIYEEGSTPFKIIASDEESVTVSSVEGIADNAIICAGVTPATPNGLLRKVNSFEQVADGYRIKTTPAALTDAINQCDIDATITFNSDGSYEVEERNNAAHASFPVEQAFAAEVIGAEISKSGDNYSMSAGFSLDVSLKIDWGKIDMSMKARTHAGCKAWLDFSAGAETDIPFFKSQGAITIYVGPVPVVFKNSLEGTLHLAGSIDAGKITAEATLDKSFGFKYTSDDGLTPFEEDNSKSPGITFETGDELINASLEAEPRLELSTLIYGFAGPSLNVGVKAEAEAGFTPLLDGGNHQGAFTIPGTQIQAVGRIAARVFVPISGHFVLEVPVNPFDGQSEKLADLTLFDTDDAILLWSFEETFNPIVGKWAANDGIGGTSFSLGGVTVNEDGTAHWSKSAVGSADYTWEPRTDGTYLFKISSHRSGSSYNYTVNTPDEVVAYVDSDGALRWGESRYLRV